MYSRRKTLLGLADVSLQAVGTMVSANTPPAETARLASLMVKSAHRPEAKNFYEVELQ